MGRSPVCNGAFRVRLSFLTLILSSLPGVVWGDQPKKAKNPDRPTLPNIIVGLHKEEIDAYDSKAEPVARVIQALAAVNRAGWGVIHEYFPTLGMKPDGLEKKAHPEDSTDPRFFAYFANEDPALSPMPLLCMVWSLPESGLSGPLKNLHDELEQSMTLEDYSTWGRDDLRKAVHGMTESATTVQGVKYRASKGHLSLKQALQLYAMTVALVRIETKWTDKADSPPPDMADFTNRLKHQLPLQVPDGGTAALFLYRPGDTGHPVTKEELEERVDVVVMSRKSATFEVEQFPVYLTADQKEWNPSWIEPRDEIKDTTLAARKYEHDWTRFDGPFLWFRPDQLNGEDIYRAIVKFQASDIVIVAQRYIERRGAVKKAERPPDYDPRKMTAFTEGVDAAATPTATTQSVVP